MFHELLKDHAKDGKDDDGKVKNVPGDLEEPPIEGQELHEAFDGEDGDEDVVDDHQNRVGAFGLSVAFNAHGDHVEKDADHNEDVELLVAGYIEEDSGERKLKENPISLD